jgi:DNA-binding Lrp family transcriptional regulator
MWHVFADVKTGEDRRYRSERQPVDRQIEAAVHHCQQRTPAGQQATSRTIQRGESAPRATQEREHGRRRDDSQPRDTQHVDARSQQHGERRAKVVKDGADDAQDVRRHFCPVPAILALTDRRGESGRGSSRSSYTQKSKHARHTHTSTWLNNGKISFEPTDQRLRGLTAVIRIRPGSRQIQRVADIARETPEVTECIRITGEDCYLMRAHLRDVQHLEEVIDRFTPFGQTTTSIMQSSPVPPWPIAIDEGGSR